MVYENVLALSKERGINLTQLEKSCGLSNATIRRWDVNSPKVDSLIKVADYFGVSLDYLTGREKFAIPNDARKYAEQFKSLPDEKKDLVKCYISVLEAG